MMARMNSEKRRTRERKARQHRALVRAKRCKDLTMRLPREVRFDDLSMQAREFLIDRFGDFPSRRTHPLQPMAAV
jgi:hypothetical protein